ILAKALNCTAPDGNEPCGKCPNCLAITAGEGVALALYGEVSEKVPDGCTEYKTSGITAYNNNRGLKYGDVFYAGEGEEVRLSLSYTGTPAEGYRFNGYAVNAGTFADAGAASGTEDPCTLMMPGQEVTVTAELAFADGLGAVAGQSISLDGDIGINFYMELSEEVLANESAYMLFTIPSGGKTETKKVYVKDVTKKNGCYVFKCGVAAKEMDSQIKAQLICGDKQGTEYTYSVREYAEYLLNNAKEDGTAVQQAYFRAVPLVEAMLQYGRYAKEYFDKTNELGDPGNVAITKPETAFDLPDGVIFGGATLSLKSETTLSLYFKCENNETLTFSCGGKTVETVSSGGYQIARIRGIAAAELQSSFTVTINDNYSATYSPMNYCFNVLNMDIDDPENPAAEVTRLQNVVKALCLYSQSARTYFGQEG
ncbi:MAG: InlB B-repeat-containing protein, partial [bacterium]